MPASRTGRRRSDRDRSGPRIRHAPGPVPTGVGGCARQGCRRNPVRRRGRLHLRQAPARRDVYARGPRPARSPRGLGPPWHDLQRAGAASLHVFGKSIAIDVLHTGRIGRPVRTTCGGLPRRARRGDSPAVTTRSVPRWMGPTSATCSVRYWPRQETRVRVTSKRPGSSAVVRQLADRSPRTSATRLAWSASFGPCRTAVIRSNWTRFSRAKWPSRDRPLLAAALEDGTVAQPRFVPPPLACGSTLAKRLALLPHVGHRCAGPHVWSGAGRQSLSNDPAASSE